jgi:CheY-like chemotaxis protein
MRINDNLIVLADDDEKIREAFSMLFESKGYVVHACADGNAALELCKQHRPGVALLDLEMPGLDGYEVAKRLRDEPDLAEMRIIAVTGRSDAQSSARAWDAGFHDFLAKPAPVSMLLAMIRPTREVRALDQEE